MGNISVEVSDGSVLEFSFSSKTTARDLVKMVCERIGAQQSYFFGLKRMREFNNPGKGAKSSKNKKENDDVIPWLWLTDHAEIFNQGVFSSTTLTLSIKYWFYEPREVDDIKSADIMYSEVKKFIVDGIYKGKLDDILYLSAIQLQIEGKNSLLLTKKNRAEYIPAYLIKSESWQTIVKQIALYESKLSNLSRLELIQKYLECVRNKIPNVTMTFAPAQYMNKDMIRKLNVAIGVGPEGVNIYEVNDKIVELVSVIRYSEIENVEITKASLAITEKKDENQMLPPDEIIDAEKEDRVTTEIPLDGVLRQLIIGPHKFIIKIFPKNKTLKEWKFDLFSFMSEEPGLNSLIENYKVRMSSYDQMLQTNFNNDYLIGVCLCDGSLRKTLQISSLDTGEQVLNQFADKLNLSDRAFFQLAAKEGDVFRWISMRQPVLLQARPNTDLFLRLRFHFSHPLEIKDNSARHLYYLQAKESVIEGKILLDEQNIVELAALQLVSSIGVASERGDKQSAVKELSQLVPERCRSLNSDSSWRKKILKCYEGLRERTAESAEEKYLKIVTDLPNYGVTFFRATIPKTSEYCYLGVGIFGACVYKAQGMELLGSYRFGFELRYWKNVSETIKFTIKASRNADEKVVSIVCCQFNEALTLLSYYDQIRKTVKETAEVNNFN